MSNPKPFARDEDGLLANIHYPRKENGSVYWRAMIPPQYLYVNPDYEDELKTRFNVKSRRDIDVSKVPDNQLLVTLSGWRELLRYRGYKSLKYRIEHDSDTKVAVTCDIEFIGNYETNGEAITHSDVAEASLYCVSGKWQLFLATMAANRALARCVRAFLGIEIYGKDEFDPEANKAFEKAQKGGINPIVAPKAEVATPTEGSPTTAIGLLEQACKSRSKPLSFDALKRRSIEAPEGLISDPKEWVDFASIPPLDTYALLLRLEKATSKPA